MSMKPRIRWRLRVGASILVSLGLPAAAFFFITRPGVATLPPLRLTTQNFTLTGATNGLAPGQASTLVLDVLNNQSPANGYTITVNSLGIATSDQSTCLASNLRINGTAFSDPSPSLNLVTRSSNQDGTTTTTSENISTASPFFKSSEQGGPISDLQGAIPSGATITSVVDNEHAIISMPALAPPAGTTPNTDAFFASVFPFSVGANGDQQLDLTMLLSGAAPASCESQTFNFSLSGNATYNASVTPTMVLTSSANPSNFGQPVTFTTTVTSSPAADGNGTVIFYDGAAAISPSEPVTGGKSTFTTSTLAPNVSHSIYAVFTPSNSSFNGAQSNTITQTIKFTTSPCINYMVNGGYTVQAGQSVCIVAPGGVNGGLMVVASGGSLYLNGANINGGLQSNNASVLLFCGSTINGGAHLTGSTGFVEVGDGGDDGTPACAGNTINGGLSVSNGSGSFEVGGNKINGGASFSGNTGLGPLGQDVKQKSAEIEANTINGGLQCPTATPANNPAPTDDGLPNSVNGGRSGQCAAGGF